MKATIKNRFISFLIFSVFITFYSGCQKQKEPVNIEPVINSYLEMWNSGNFANIDSIITKNFELRVMPTFEPSVGIDSLKKSITETRKMFPDFTVNIKERIATGDTAIVATWTMEGTYSEKNGSTVQSRKISVPGFSIIFFSGNKLTGEWIAWSDLTVMKQLGFSLVPPMKSKK